MLFKKSYGDLVKEALGYIVNGTDITNTNVGGITRSLIEIINKNISDYYDVLDINMAMCFVSSSQGYYLDLIGGLFSLTRTPASQASSGATQQSQKFYVVSGVLFDYIPSGVIPAGTTVSTSDGLIVYTVTSNTNFAAAATEVYVPITSVGYGNQYNVPAGVLTSNSLGLADVFTTNNTAIVNGSSTESDGNFKYRIMNATLSAERANSASVKLAALSVNGVANVIVRPYARGIGSYDVIVIPTSGIANASLILSVQTAIEAVQAVGMKGTAIAPTIVPVNISVTLIFTRDATSFEQRSAKSLVKSSIERYMINIPLGGTFILNELRQQIMDVSPKIKDHIISCYMFREEPVFLGNVNIYWDEVFYPNPSSPEAIIVT